MVSAVRPCPCDVRWGASPAIKVERVKPCSEVARGPVWYASTFVRNAAADLLHLMARAITRGESKAVRSKATKTQHITWRTRNGSLGGKRLPGCGSESSVYSDDDDRPANTVGTLVNRAAVTGKHLSSSHTRVFFFQNHELSRNRTSDRWHVWHDMLHFTTQLIVPLPAGPLWSH